MKFISSISWIKRKYLNVTYRKYRVKYVPDFPSRIAKKTIFIVQEGIEPETLILKCPCGCDADIYLNLLQDTRPRWDFIVNNKNKVSITPSICRTKGCKSHFFIRNGKIIWAGSEYFKI